MKRVERDSSVPRRRSVHASLLSVVILVSAFVLALLPASAAAQTGGISVPSPMPERAPAWL